jgi:HEAT repeat protein
MPQVLKALTDDDPKLRVTMAYVLGQAGLRFETYGAPHFRPKLAVPPLVDALTDKERLVRLAAAYALGECGRGDTRAVRALMKALEDKDSNNDPNGDTVSQAAASALARLGDSADLAIPALIERLKTADQGLGFRIIGALGSVRTRPHSVIPILANVVKDKTLNQRIREIALNSLHRYAKDHREAVEAIASVLDDENQAIRKEAARMLNEIMR